MEILNSPTVVVGMIGLVGVIWSAVLGKIRGPAPDCKAHSDELARHREKIKALEDRHIDFKADMQKDFDELKIEVREGMVGVHKRLDALIARKGE